MTVGSSPAKLRRQRRLAAKRVFTLLLLTALVGASVWINREVLLRLAGELWIISDDIHPADAVAILGGGLDTRPFAAAKDYHNGLTHKILVADVKLSEGEPSHTVLNRNLLIKLGVPETDIETFGRKLANTYEEANALREWVVRSHARSVIVPIEIFSSRRVNWMLTHALVGTATAVQIQALDHPKYSGPDWWKSHEGRAAFQTEIFKYFYYRLKYRT
jgi:uncharacterized SAM-binding protein YcdF (DUF218 family)